MKIFPFFLDFVSENGYVKRTFLAIIVCWYHVCLMMFNLRVTFGEVVDLSWLENRRKAEGEKSEKEFAFVSTRLV